MLTHSIAIAIIAIVYRRILAYEPILNWWFKLGMKFSNYFFYKPIWGCEKCFAGQLALWTYLLNAIFINKDIWLYKIIEPYTIQHLSLLEMLIFVTSTILMTAIFAKIYETYIQ